MNSVGKGVIKKDAMALVTGQPVYCDDLAPKDCLIVKLLRSPHAYAKIRSIDTSIAKRIPGIEAVYTYEDVPTSRFTLAGQSYPEPSPYDRRILENVVRYVGEGADEFFGGYNIYHEPISLRGFRYVPKFIKKPLAALFKKLPDFKGRDFIIRGSKTVEERFIGNANMFSVEDREKLLKTKLTHVTPQQIVAPYYKKVEGLNDIAKMQYIDINFWLQGDILLKADKMSMAHSLESRVPFLDINVFNYTKKLPIDYRCNKEATKRAFRIAAKRHIPEATANKKKLGFPVPIRVWLKEDKYYNKVMEKLTGETAKKYFDTAALKKLMEDHRNGKADNSRKIWTVYVFLIWHEVYMESDEVNVPA